MSTQNTSKKFSAEVPERAVRMVFEHQDEYESQWAAMNSMAAALTIARMARSVVDRTASHELPIGA